MARQAGVITVSDRGARGDRPDHSGPLLCMRLEAAGFAVVRYQVVPDEPRLLEKILAEMVAQRYPLVVATGGTGLGGRDRVPDLLERWADGAVPGFGERMRGGPTATTPYAALSRGGAWVRGRTLILALPGSPKGAQESLEAVLPVLDHALDVMAGAGHPRPGGGA